MIAGFALFIRGVTLLFILSNIVAKKILVRIEEATNPATERGECLIGVINKGKKEKNW